MARQPGGRSRGTEQQGNGSTTSDVDRKHRRMSNNRRRLALVVPTAVSGRGRMLPISAIVNGNVDRINSLLDAKADINATTNMGTTALHWSVAHGSIQLTTFLVRRGAEVGARNQDGDTPLHVAALQGNMPAVEFIVALGNPDAAVSTRGQYSRTPLHCAAVNGHEDIVGLLMQNGADPLAGEVRNRCAIQLAAGMSEANAEKLPDLHFTDLQADMEKRVRNCKHLQCVMRIISESDGVERRLQFSRLSSYPTVAVSVLSGAIEIRQAWGNTQRILYDFTLISPPDRKLEPMVLKQFNGKAEVIFSHPLVLKLLEHKWQLFGKRAYTFDLLVLCAYLITAAVLVFYYWIHMKEGAMPGRDDEFYIITLIFESGLQLAALFRVYGKVRDWCTGSAVSHGSHKYQRQQRMLTLNLIIFFITRTLLHATSARWILEVHRANILACLATAWFNANDAFTIFPTCAKAQATYTTMMGALMQFAVVFLLVLMGFSIAFSCLFSELVYAKDVEPTVNISLPTASPTTTLSPTTYIQTLSPSTSPLVEEERLLDNWWKVISWLLIMAVGHLEPISDSMRYSGDINGTPLVIAWTALTTILLLTFLTALMDNRFQTQFQRIKENHNFEFASKVLNAERLLSEKEYRENWVPQVVDETQQHTKKRSQDGSEADELLTWLETQFNTEVRELQKKVEELIVSRRVRHYAAKRKSAGLRSLSVADPGKVF